MAVDRGGLEYRIQVVDQFSAQLESFRAQLKGAQSDFKQFQTNTAKTTGAGSSARSKQLSIEEAAQKKLNAELRRARVADKEAQLAEEQGIVTQKQAQILEKSRLGTIRTLTKLKADFARSERAAAAEAARAARAASGAATAEERRAKAIAKVNEAQRSGFSKFLQTTEVTNANTIATGAMASAQDQYAKSSKGLFARLKEQAAAQKEITAGAGKSEGAFNNLLFTFRRLIGVFAAFLVVRQVVGAITSSIGEAIRFNAQLESATLGIASVITAAGDVKDAMGGAATNAEKFAIANKAASDQVQKLRKDALATNATFEQLLDTFQVAIGPGLAAGLDLDEIRKLTVRISQAAAAIGLPQNQLAEEVRSILSGTIQLRTTRLAAVLGITNADIKNARELGTLVEFLDQKFQAFGQSGEASLKTFNVLLSNTGDALKQAFAQGGTGFFEQIKSGLNDVLTTVANVSKESQTVEINPKLLIVLQAAFAGLESAVQTARDLFDNLNADDFLQTAQAVGTAISGTAKFLSIAIDGFVKGLNTASGIFLTIVGAAKAVGSALGLGATGGFFSEALSIAVQIFTTFAALRVSLLGIGKLMGFIFVNTLGEGVVGILKLVKGAESFRDVLLIIQLAFIENPIGLALTLIAATIGVIAQRLGLFKKLFGSTNDEVKKTATSVADLVTQFKSLQGQISGAADNSGKFAENIKDLTDDLRKTQLQTTFDVQTAGLDGGVRQEAQLFADAQIEFQTKSLELTRNLTTANSDVLGIQRKRAVVEKEIAAFGTTQHAQIEIVTAALKKQFSVSQAQAKNESELSSKKLALGKALAEGTPDAVSLQFEVGGLEDQQKALKDAEKNAAAGVQHVADIQHQLIASGILTQKQSDELFASVKDRIELEGQEVSTKAQIVDLTGQQGELETLISSIRDQRLQGIAAQEVQRLNDENVQLELQIRQIDRLRAARQGVFEVETQDTRLAAAQNALDAEQTKLMQLQIDQVFELANAQANAAAATDPTTKAFLEGQVLAIQRNQNNELEIQNRLIAEANQKLLVQQQIKADPIGLGFESAFETFAADANDIFAHATELMTATLNGFADLISTTLADAFDPNKKGDTKARFASFLNELFSLILSFFVKIAIAKAALSIFGGPTGAIAGVAIGDSPVSFAEGGVVPSIPGIAPAGVPRSDTVNAWLTPGEPVSPVSSAKKYGYDFFEMIRTGALDATLVRGLMRGSGMAGVRTGGSRGRGYAVGGVATAATATAAAQAGSPTGPGFLFAVVAPTERAAARQAAGGRRSRLRATAQDLRDLRGG